MRKKLSLIDFTIRDELTPEAYVDWADLKNEFDSRDYCELLKFLYENRIPCKKKWLETKFLIMFLSSQKILEDDLVEDIV